MGKLLKVGVLVALATILAILPPSMPADAQASCTYTLGFKALRDQIPDVVGECRESEHFNAGNGNVEQQTTRGLLVWRKVDNWTAFTDGGTTWINGPYGLLSRPNDRQFMWEVYNVPAGANIDPTALIDPRCCNSDSTAAQPPAPPPPAPAPNAFVGDTVTYGQWQLTLEKFYRDSQLPDSSLERIAKPVYPKGVFITVILTAKNLGNASAGLPRFKLADNSGRLFDQDGRAGLYGSWKYDVESGYIARIQPSLSARVAIGFDVASDADGFVLRVVV